MANRRDSADSIPSIQLFLCCFILYIHTFEVVLSLGWSKYLSRMADNMERGGATRRRAKQIATAFHKPFRCL